MRNTLSINPPLQQAVLLGLVMVALVAFVLLSGSVPAMEMGTAGSSIADPNLAP